MQVFDVRDKLIELGQFVRYTGTGTIGKVIDLKEENNVNWVKIDETGLWYSSDLVEILDDKYVKNKSKNFKAKEIDIDDIKNLKDDFEDVELESNNPSGGG
jgi:hypothetical protein